MPDLVFVKLGGSLLTDKSRPEAARPEVVRRLAADIADVARASRREGGPRLLVGHGSGSFGHVAAARYGIASGLTSPDQLSGISETQDRVAALHRLVIGALVEAGALPFSIAPSSMVVASGGRPAEVFVEPLLLALERGLLPVVYGDVVLDRAQGIAICSTEALFVALARALSERGIAIRRALWLGETDGVHDHEGRTTQRLSRATMGDVAGAVTGAAGTDVTGGMRLRLDAALELADLGIPSLVANGLLPGLLGRALAGEPVPGTEVVPLRA